MYEGSESPPPGPDRVKHRNTIQERFLYGGGGGAAVMMSLVSKSFKSQTVLISMLIAKHLVINYFYGNNHLITN